MGSDIQELYCNECRRYLRVKTKPWKNGKIIIVCDHCRHQHCRWVKNGRLSDGRWGVKNGVFNGLFGFPKAPKGTGVMANSDELTSNSYEMSLWEEGRNKR